MMLTEEKIYLKGFRSWAEISRERLIKNVKTIHNHVNKHIFAVVKADAYGHGALKVSEILQDIPYVKYLCVATAEEGKELREKGINKDILVLGGILKDEVKCFKDYRLVPVVSDFEQLKIVRENDIPKIHIKIDTGMHRLGFLPEEVEDLIQKISGLKIEGVMSHFPSADTDPDLTNKQIKDFEKIVKIFRSYGVDPDYIHLQNSAGLMYECSYCNAVRIGISIYGEKPSDSFNIPVKTVMSVKSKIITVKKIKKGQTISYGGRFKADRDMKIGVVAFGYADGLSRELSNRGYFLINDRKVQIVGTITMDMTMVDLTDIEGVKPMDTVTIVGKDNKNEIYFDDIAKMCNTIPYEIMCRISKRVRRVVV